MNNERTPTTERLAGALAKSGASQHMIDKALSGCYDDYKSDALAPIHDLVADARKEGLTEIADRAINGEFDGTEWEAEEWAASPEGIATLRECGLI